MLIPKNIYQSWHTKKLHQKVQEHVIDVLKKIILIIPMKFIQMKK